MWVKKHFWKLPGRYVFLLLYHLLVVGAWRAGRVGWIWTRLRTEIYRMQDYKVFEMNLRGHVSNALPSRLGLPDTRVRQYD